MERERARGGDGEGERERVTDWEIIEEVIPIGYKRDDSIEADDWSEKYSLIIIIWLVYDIIWDDIGFGYDIPNNILSNSSLVNDKLYDESGMQGGLDINDNIYDMIGRWGDICICMDDDKLYDLLLLLVLLILLSLLLLGDMLMIWMLALL